jgi:Protein of unknown function (DUF2795)
MIGYASENVIHAVRGMVFPASKADLIERARNSSAGQDALEILASLPEGARFECLADLVATMRGTDQAPQTGVIDVKP